MSDLIPLLDACRLTGARPGAALHWIDRGWIVGRQGAGGVWYVAATSLADLAAHARTRRESRQRRQARRIRKATGAPHGAHNSR